MNRRFGAGGLSATVLVLSLAACGGTASPGATGQSAATAQPGAAGAATAAPSGTGPVTGHVGDKLTFHLVGGFDTADATLVKIFDPATPNDASEAPLEPGVHWVGVEVVLDNHSPDDGDEQSELDAVTSAGTTVTVNDSYNGGSYVLGDGFQGCTQTSGSEQDMQPYTHCAAFPVPDGQTLTQVGAKVGGAEIDSSLLPHDQAVWTVP